tara:strand:+ start:481 stop:1086 length:606 start_codon:yes stop_codon:yes gene_type:complete
MSVLLIHSHFGEVAPVYAAADLAGQLTIVRERDLRADDLAKASGLITTTHLDQIGLLDHADALQDMLNSGGRWFFNGHMMRRFVPGLDLYVPLKAPRRADYALTRLYEHPLFAGIEQRQLEENKGVAGFYGRGHNPLPAGGQPVNGIGPAMLPVDWVWARPQGGAIFSHAGNDLSGMIGDHGQGALLGRRIIDWCRGELAA